jgi:hypothetical protein
MWLVGSRCASTGTVISLGALPGLHRPAGIVDDAAFLGEPETNGCAERWIRTLKEQCLWTTLYDSVDELRQALAGFVQTYNTQRLIGRLGHRTPKEAYQAAPPPRRHDQIDIGAVQPSGRCSPLTSTPQPSRSERRRSHPHRRRSRRSQTRLLVRLARWV